MRDVEGGEGHASACWLPADVIGTDPQVVSRRLLAAHDHSTAERETAVDSAASA
jgi:hypothetical protein